MYYPERGAKVVLDEFIEDFNIHKGEIRARSGKPPPPRSHDPDCGPRPNTAIFYYIRQGHSHTSVKNKPTLQVVNHPRIFAAGDVFDWQEQKQIGKYGNHAAVVAANIFTLLSGGEPTKVYKAHEMIVIAIG